MKRVLSLSIILACFSCVFAQGDVTKFLGIPVDGYKSEMIQKLKAKGYQYSAAQECFTGEFNGRDVNIFIGTNNNKVYRIMVADANYVSEGDIKIRFNTLCRQFEKNDRYIKPSLEDYTISEDEDISYEMAVHNKRYQAAYYQVNQKQDSAALAAELSEYVKKKYGSDEEIANMSDDDKISMVADLMVYSIEKYSDNSVWFMISEHYGRYGILIFYDNKKNQADGEEL